MLLNVPAARIGRGIRVFLLCCCLVLGLLPQLASTVASASESLFEKPAVNRLLDQNYRQVQRKGYAKLVLPASLHGLTDKDFSPDALRAARTLIAAGHEAYIVGGAVRDILMGTEANDFDVVTSNGSAAGSSASQRYHHGHASPAVQNPIRFPFL